MKTVVIKPPTAAAEPKGLPAARCRAGSRRGSGRRWSLPGAAAALFAMQALAADDPAALGDLDIEQLMNLPVEQVYGASRYQQKVTQAPASISIVTAEEIRRLGYRTLADVLRSMRGLYVADDRNYSYLGARGFLRPGDYNTRVLVLIDGHRMNDNIYDGAYLAHEAMIDVDLIERVEFIRGPSSSIYGSSAFFGVINVITRQLRELEGVELSADAGSFGSRGGRASFGGRFGESLELLVSGSWRTSHGQDLYFPEFDPRISSNPRAANDGVARDADAEDALQLFSRLRYRGWSLSGFLSSRSKQVPTASFETVFNSPLERTEDNRGYVDLRHERELGKDLQLLARLFYDKYTYYGDYPYDYAAAGDPPDILVSRDEARGEWLGTEWQLTRRLGRHTLLAGAEYRENLQQTQRTYDVGVPDSLALDDRRSSRVLGIYAQGEFAMGEHLRLNTGLRYDSYFGGFGGTLNPRVGLIYSPWEQTTLKALYGQAYRAPNSYEQYYYAQQAGIALDPETIRTYELVCEQQLGRHHRFSVSGYHYDIKDLISQASTPEGDLHYQNLDRAEGRGIEFEAEGKYDSGLHVLASYARQRTEDANTARELSSSPRHLAKLRLSLPLYDQLHGGFELQYFGGAGTLAGARTDDALIANLNLSSRSLVVKGLDLSAGIYNLFDAQYGHPGAADHAQDVIAQDGRSFRLKLSYQF